MGKIEAICISERKGTEKKNIDTCNLIENYGLENDAHAGNWHRQVSLLSKEEVDAFNARGGDAIEGAFGENLLISGLDVASLPVQSRLKSGDVILEITQIGKECHTHCAIFHRVGDCIMPRKGVFAKVIRSGVLHIGDEIEVIENPDWKLQAAVITLSDQGYAGKREDLSGPKARDILEAHGFEVVEMVLLPDEQKRIEKELKRLADQRQISLIVTTGGTGFSRRDVTPEATKAIIERDVPGISEAIRAESAKYTSRAMLSRGISGLRGSSLIVNLPGSPKAVAESLEVFLEPAIHGLKILYEQERECAH